MDYIIKLTNNKTVELFTQKNNKNKYLANASEEHIEFTLSNVKLGINKYLTVITHLPFNHEGKQYYPIGQLSVITNEKFLKSLHFLMN